MKWLAECSAAALGEALQLGAPELSGWVDDLAARFSALGIDSEAPAGAGR